MHRAALLLVSLLGLPGCLSSTGLGGSPSMASGSTGLSGNAQGASSALPHCVAPLGTVALVEGQYSGYSGLGSPLPVLRLMMAQSGCFNVVDRGQGLSSIRQEEALTGGTNQGGQSLVRAQYYLTPQIVFSDSNSSGGGLDVGTWSRKLLGDRVGSLVGGVDLQNGEAQSVLFLTQTDSGLQVAAAEGSATNRDISLRGSGLLGGLSGGSPRLRLHRPGQGGAGRARG